MRVVVLGAKGFVGSAFAAFLEAQGFQVVGVSRDDYDRFAGTSCDVLVNAAGNSSKRLADRNPLEDFDRNVRATLKALVDFPARTVLHLSSIDVYNDLSDPARNAEDVPVVPETLSPYGFNKWLAERVVRRHAPRAVIFRLGGMFGRNSRKGPAHDILKGLPIWVSPASRFLFLDTATVARLAWALHDRAGETFNLTAADNLSLDEFAALVEKPIAEVRGKEVLTYRISVEKVSAIVPLPTSREAVLAALKTGKIP